MNRPHINPRRLLAAALALLLGAVLPFCRLPPPAPHPTAPPAFPAGAHIILDFESPDPPVEWIAPATNQAPHPPATRPRLSRSSIRPDTGLWSLKVELTPGESGSIIHRPAKLLNLTGSDTLSVSVMQAGPPARGGEWTASITITDTDQRSCTSDAYPILSQWQRITLDLQDADEQGLNLSRIASVALALHPAETSATRPAATNDSPNPLEIQTDSWFFESRHHAYVGPATAPAKSFFVRQHGPRLSVGMADQYEIVFHDSAGADPWLEILQGPAPQRQILGQPNTGLILLNQNAIDALAPAIRQTPYTAAPIPPAPLIAAWPARAVYHWRLVWTSPIAALVEVKEESGPYDRLGEPANSLTWRFMIYQWGQVFVHLEREGRVEERATDRPIAWALALTPSVMNTLDPAISATSPADAERLLAAVYPVSVTEGLITALPHQMQTGAPIVMLAKSGPADASLKDIWWALSGNPPQQRKLLGVPLPRTNAADRSVADCMLLINSPAPLMQAASFGQYLLPPKIVTRQGELDRNFPGDVDNDGFNEAYGFQVIRLANGRAEFTIYPQGRPIFYPVYLFTVPAVERETVDLKNSRVLINIDGKQFADPPQFPDGSFLLQLPYILDKPVTIEALLVKK